MTTILPQHISHASRQLMATTDWEWRHKSYTDPAFVAAALILRRQSHRARQWLTAVSELAGMPLPVGNGINGPWNRIACVTPTGRLGIVDIAAGLAVEYDAACPSYVRRFAMVTDRGSSPNDAGGSGGIPAGWTQIALTLGGDGSGRVVAPESVQPLRIVWGYQTCYGDIGTAPTADDWRKEWSQYVGRCEIAETTEPQREEIKLGSGVDPAVWGDFRKSVRLAYGLAAISTSGSHTGGRVYVYVTGTRAVREQTIGVVLTEWRAYVVRRSQETIAKLWDSCGLSLPDTAGGRQYCSWDHGTPDGYQRNTVAAALTVDPLAALTPEQAAVIRATAEQMLAVDPQVVAEKLVANGDAKYPLTGRNLSLCGQACGVEKWLHHRAGNDAWMHVGECPGVREWRDAVIAAIPR